MGVDPTLQTPKVLARTPTNITPLHSKLIPHLELTILINYLETITSTLARIHPLIIAQDLCLPPLNSKTNSRTNLRLILTHCLDFSNLPDNCQAAKYSSKLVLKIR